MKVLITGASSGIGKDMAVYLSQKGHELFIAARSTERLNSLQAVLPSKATVITVDLSDERACFSLYEQLADEKIEVLINNAGFGVYGRFDETDIDRELSMIDTNIKAVHILTKCFLKDFISRNQGYILNVASAAAFLPGPLFAGYYASKAYVLRFTQAIYEELRRQKSRVYIGTLCPGPVRTEFDAVAGVGQRRSGLDSQTVAKIGLEGMFAKKPVIIPGTAMKLAKIFSKFMPDRILLKASYHVQKSKW